MNNKQLVAASKFLSLVLRHQPTMIGLQLDDQGWAEIDELLEKSLSHGKRIDRDLLTRVVAENDKQRFAISDDGQRIRANQGHSIDVNLQLKPQTPPARLYHGTVDRFLDSIRRTGLQKRKRHHVHLSADLETAERVGGRRGDAVILVVRCDEMVANDVEFFLSDNDVWLTDHVQPQYIDFPD